MRNKRVLKVAIAATLVLTATLSQAISSSAPYGTVVNPAPAGIPTYFSRTWHTTVSDYGGSTAGVWNLYGTEYKHYIFYGEKLDCPRAASEGCSQDFSSATDTMWTLATEVTYQQTIIPAVNELSATWTFTAGKTFTDTNTFTVNLAAGQKAQHVRYVPRRQGEVTIRGVRIHTGRYQNQCKRDGALRCYEWVKAYEYFNDPKRTAGVMVAKKNTSKPITSFIPF